MITLFYRFMYRLLSKLMHRYGVHQMRQNEYIDPCYILHTCRWCGLRGKTMKPSAFGEVLKRGNS